ncbi:DUF2238 domain-containing protein [Tahibacter caeni]|uniref:DUF2238 domain-containing protein n=1 Tax=Tahibacter caeni TaxID=1453545 RepID=UPI0021482ECD|nr:DUF2238 domain-containing protein [Tahibacter caeni]
MTQCEYPPHASAAPSLRYPTVLLVLFGLYWLVLAIKPWFRQDWLLENALVFALVPLLAATARRFRFSDASYTLLFVFLCLHEVGAHYTYAEVPYDDAWRALTGQSLDAWLGFQRNHYDRLIHFLSGALLLPVAGELLRRQAAARGVWAAVLPVLFILAQSALFELIEWAAAVVFGGDLGQAYLGTQGDEWDAQRDMALALLGALLAQGWLSVRATIRDAVDLRQRRQDASGPQ